jgi:hypothetical protein
MEPLPDTVALRVVFYVPPDNTFASRKVLTVKLLFGIKLSLKQKPQNACLALSLK